MKENPNYPRRSGRTTRIADEIIQALFQHEGEDKWIPIADHYSTPKASDLLYKIIRRRLESEHPSVKIEIHKENYWIYIRIKNG